MSEAWVAVITGVISAAVSLTGIITANRKSTGLILYRVEQLEKKQDKHNNAIERLTKLEGKVEEIGHDMDEVKKRIA